MIEDAGGLAALRAAAPPARRTFLDDLSGEAVALAGGVLLQAKVERSDPMTDRVTARATRCRTDRRRCCPSTAMTRPAHNATMITTGVGYVRDDTLVYRRRNGAEDHYSLRSADNLFGCIQLRTTQRDGCQVRRLAHYGVRSAAQLQTFMKVERANAWVTALWMLVRTHEPAAAFPTTECRTREATGCASWSAFARRLHLVIPND
jgi:hypothetical protein